MELQKFEKEKSVVLFFAYPTNLPEPLSGGSFIWTKKVADYIEETKKFEVKKVTNDRIVSEDESRIYRRTYNYFIDTIFALRALCTNPDIAILTSVPMESNILLWILLQIIKPHTKVILVFHHYEPRKNLVKNTLAKKLVEKHDKLIHKLAKVMVSKSTRVLTVSSSSAFQLRSVYEQYDDSRTVDVIRPAIEMFPVYDMTKDIDFLCVGRTEKFDGLENIWTLIKNMKPDSKFVMCGPTNSNNIDRLRSLKIEHRGEVFDDEKIELYSRAKVFIFPSIWEGFGMAVAEALYAGLPVVAWKIPVFEELYGDKPECVKLIELQNYNLFAEEAVRNVIKQTSNKRLRNCNIIMRTWDQVGEEVTNIINELA
jgi:glycosyltransferase involved in cell wall biosynthesis